MSTTVTLECGKCPNLMNRHLFRDAIGDDDTIINHPEKSYKVAKGLLHSSDATLKRVYSGRENASIGVNELNEMTRSRRERREKVQRARLRRAVVVMLTPIAPVVALICVRAPARPAAQMFVPSLTGVCGLVPAAKLATTVCVAAWNSVSVLEVWLAIHTLVPSKAM